MHSQLCRCFFLLNAIIFYIDEADLCRKKEVMPEESTNLESIVHNDKKGSNV